MDLVTIATFPDLPEAELAKERLRSEGIQAFVLHENSRGVLPFLTQGIEVQVPDTDAARAREILST